LLESAFMDTSPRDSDEPLVLFASWLRQRARADPEDIETLARSHPLHAPALRVLERHWSEIEPALRLAGISLDQTASFAERLAMLHGADVDPAIALDSPSTDLGESSKQVLTRLGRRLGFWRYTIEGEITHGGMGSILRAWDEDIRRHIAMKVILERESPNAPNGRARVDPSQLARFLEEAQVTGQLEHPSIVPVHELGLDPSGRVYFTMKLVKGRDLRAIYDLVFDGNADWSETRALNVVLKVCEAVAYAHKKGVIHRDLKPGNVMVGDFGEVYVMDWGLARVIGRKDRHDPRIAPDAGSTRSVRTERREEREAAPDSPILTMDGTVVGSPAYMSPEQARGDAAAIDSRSDVYAIGAMLYHLLARQMPYVPLGARVSQRTILGMVLHGPPQKLVEFRRNLPAELVAICERAMSRRAEERYATTLELADDLRAYLENRVVRAYRTGAWAELSTWTRRNRGTAAAMAGVGASLLVGAILVLQGKAATRQRDQVLADLELVRNLVNSADGLWSALPSEVPILEEWITAADAAAASQLEYERSTSDVLEPSSALAVKARRLLEEHRPSLKRERTRVQGLWESAKSLEARTVSSPAAQARWRAAIDAIAMNPRYGGSQIRPQLGLLPLGENSSTGLWEFWHVLSGAEPGTDGTQRPWTLEAQTGVVLVLLPRVQTALGSIPFTNLQASTAEELFQLAPSQPEWGTPWHDPAARPQDGFLEGIELDPFFMSKYELTQSQYARLTGRRPSQGARADTHPVEYVSWNEAQAALARVELQLPTDVQWEYACRAGTTSPFWTGWTFAELQGAANIADRTRGRSPFAMGQETAEVEDLFLGTAPVGLVRPNGFGLFDVHGNVWEWCRDGYRLDRNPRDGDGLAVDSESIDAKVLRGGSFFTPARNVRSAYRLTGGFAASDRDGDVGVRPSRPLMR